MSAIANPSSAPQPPAPVLAPPKAEIPKPPRRWPWVVLVALIVVLGAWLLRPQAQQSAAQAGMRTARVSQGAFRQTIRLSGVTSAKNFASIAAPMMRGPDAGRSLVLIELVKSGTLVKKGDTIAQIDAQSIKDHVDDVDSQVTQAEADIRKRQAEQAIQMENLRQNLRVAKASLDKARLDNSAAEVRTAIDIELLKLTVDEADATYKQLQQDLKNMADLHRAEIRILEYTRDRHARHRDRHKIDVTRFTMKAPIDGLAVMTSIWRGGEMGQVQLGDQVSPGQPFMKLVDPRSMQVEATANQSESESVRITQKATVEFDAFPGLKLPGEVSSIGAIAIRGWREQYYVRNVPVKVDIKAVDNRVIPDLSASADVVLEERPNTLMTPIESVHDEGGAPVVYVKRGENQWERRVVKVGGKSATHFEVLSGIKSGEEVALQKPVQAGA